MGKADELLLQKYKATPTFGESIKELGRSFSAGTAAYPKAIADIVQAATELTPLPDTELSSFRNYAQEIQQFYNPNEALQQTSWREHPIAKLTQGIAGAAPTTIPAMGAGLATGSAYVPAAIFGVMAGGETYRSAREAGKTTGLALATGIARGLGEFAGETVADIPLLKILGGEIEKPVAQALQQMVIEGSTEGLQQIWQNLVEKWGFDKARPIMEGALDSAIIGAGMGGALSGAGVLSAITQPHITNRQKIPSQPPTTKQAAQHSVKPEVPATITKKPKSVNVGKIVLNEQPLDVIVMPGEKAHYAIELHDSEGRVVDRVEGTQTEIKEFYNALPKQPVQTIPGIEQQPVEQVMTVAPQEQPAGTEPIALPEGKGQGQAVKPEVVKEIAVEEGKPKPNQKTSQMVQKESARKIRERIRELKKNYKEKDFSIDRGESMHNAPSPENSSPLYDVTEKGTYPEDVYSPEAIQYYGTGEDVLDAKAHSIIKQAEGKPNKTLTIYRAVEKDYKAGINPGDWVTPVKEYAVEHGESYLPAGYKIIAKKVTAKDLYTNGDSWLEWGYHPQEDFTKQKPFTSQEPMTTKKAKPFTSEQQLTQEKVKKEPKSSLKSEKGEVSFGPSAEDVLKALSKVQGLIEAPTLPYKERASVREYKRKGNIITNFFDKLMLPERYLEYQSKDTRRVKALLDNIRTKYAVESNRVELLLDKMMKVKESPRLVEFLKYIDRNEKLNTMQKYYEEVDRWEAAKKLTKKEADALRARGKLRADFWMRMARLIMEHKAGIKTTLQGRQYLYNGTWHNEEWFDKHGKSYEHLPVRYKFSLSKSNPKTGKTEKQTLYLEKPEDIEKIVNKETYKFLAEVLPYKANYVSGARTRGSHWVRVYPANAENKEDPLFAFRGSYSEVKQVANALSKKLDKDFTIDITPHIKKYSSFPLRTNPYDVIFYLNNKVIDIESPEAKKLIEATRSISNIARHLIASKDVAGKSYKWKDVLHEDMRQAFSAINAHEKNQISRLKAEVPKLIKDAEEQNITAQYLDLLNSFEGKSHWENLMENVLKPAMYGAVLWNSPTYIAQNLSEGIWAYPEAVEALGEAGGIYATLRPLNSHEAELYKKAKKEGYIPMWMPASELLRKGWGAKALAKTDLGRLSEKFSADTAYKIGLKVASQLGYKTDKSKMLYAARFVNKVKPIYSKANIPLGVLSKGGVNFGQNVGLFPFLRWTLDMYSKVYGSAKTGKFGKVTKFLLLSIALAGLSALPPEWRKKPKEAFRRLFGEKGARFIENGLPGLFFDISSEFMSPLSIFSWKKWFSGEGNALAILADLITREAEYIKKYGLAGVPMGFGAFKGWKNYKKYGEYGYKRKYGKSYKTLWWPSNQELIMLMMGFMPQSLIDVFEEQRAKRKRR